jgi:hypothetical protein
MFMWQDQLPQVGGKALVHYLQKHKQTLVGYADVSFKNDQASHAWIIGTGDHMEIEDSMMMIMGSGLVDGHHLNLSSSCRELQGQTAMAIITRLLLEATDSQLHTTFTGDNQGVQNNIMTLDINKLAQHRMPKPSLHCNNQSRYPPLWMYAPCLRLMI